MSAPVFIAVVPAEVDSYGAAAAILLALIRYRTAHDGPYFAEHIEREGCRWWRVSLRALAAETGLSVKAVRTALKALHEVVLAKQFAPLSDQSLAYRIESADDALTGQLPPGARSDLPVAPAGKPDAPAGKDRAPAGTPPCPSGHLHSSSKTLEEGEECGGDGRAADEHEDPPAASSESEPFDPFDYGDDPPEDLPIPVGDAAPASAGPTPIWVRGPHGPRCRRHVNDPNPPGCGGCKEAREAADAEAEAKRDAEKADVAAIKAERDACGFCDHNGMTHGDEPRRCTRHRQLSDAERAS